MPKHFKIILAFRAFAEKARIQNHGAAGEVEGTRSRSNRIIAIKNVCFVRLFDERSEIFVKHFSQKCGVLLS